MTSRPVLEDPHGQCGDMLKRYPEVIREVMLRTLRLRLAQADAVAKERCGVEARLRLVILDGCAGPGELRLILDLPGEPEDVIIQSNPLEWMMAYLQGLAMARCL